MSGGEEGSGRRVGSTRGLHTPRVGHWTKALSSGKCGCSPLQAPGPQKRSPQLPRTAETRLTAGGCRDLVGFVGSGGHGRGWLHRGPPPVCGKPTQRGGWGWWSAPCLLRAPAEASCPRCVDLASDTLCSGTEPRPLSLGRASPEIPAGAGLTVSSGTPSLPDRCLTCPHCSSLPSVGCSGAHRIPSALPGGRGLGEGGGRGGGAGRQRAETEVPSPRAPRGTWEHTHGSRAGRKLGRGSPGHGPPEAVSCSDPTWHPDPSVRCRGEKGAGQSCPAWEPALGGSGWGSPGGKLSPWPAWKKRVWHSWPLALAAPLPARASSVWNASGKTCPGPEAPGWAAWGCLGAQAGLGPPLSPLTWGWGLPPSAGQAPLLSHAW
uniref:Uncharacterized protein n=1 Tax=Mustela putorius furo TaxID=9669 RepID=M3Z855_MUSPF